MTYLRAVGLRSCQIYSAMTPSRHADDVVRATAPRDRAGFMQPKAVDTVLRTPTDLISFHRRSRLIDTRQAESVVEF